MISKRVRVALALQLGAAAVLIASASAGGQCSEEGRYCDDDCYHTSEPPSHWANVDAFVCNEGIPDYVGTFQQEYFSHPASYEAACILAADECEFWVSQGGSN